MPEQPPIDPAQFLANLFQSSQDALRPFQPGEAATAARPESDPLAFFASATLSLAQLQQDYVKQMMALWGMPGLAGLMPVALSGAPNVVDDKRFAGAAWKNDPRFDALTRGYLAYADFLKNAVDGAAVDGKTRDQLRFAVRQFIDAISPANFLSTNPEAVQLALETGGQSLIEGTQLFFKDFAKGRVTMTDEAAFVVGRDIAVMPGSVVFENALIQLIQYAPATDTVFARPLVIIPPCINKYYILDLTPDNSFVRHAVLEGHTVFLASWRNITADEERLTWDDYLQQGVMAAIDTALDITRADQVNTLGFCVGGTLLSSALAVMKANDEDKATSATLLTTMLDYSEPGEIGTMVTA
ncbi:MAG: class I poly(R)-hydroxyalkanoic acid synthase, partial [Betaproteobacteria bacterium]